MFSTLIINFLVVPGITKVLSMISKSIQDALCYSPYMTTNPETIDMRVLQVIDCAQDFMNTATVAKLHVNTFARYGVLESCKWARKNGCSWNKWTCAEAAKYGHLHVLQWLRDPARSADGNRTIRHVPIDLCKCSSKRKPPCAAVGLRSNEQCRRNGKSLGRRDLCCRSWERTPSCAAVGSRPSEQCRRHGMSLGQMDLSTRSSEGTPRRTSLAPFKWVSLDISWVRYPTKSADGTVCPWDYKTCCFAAAHGHLDGPSKRVF